MVVSFEPVYMVDLMTRRAGPQKCCGHQSMNEHASLSPIDSWVDYEIPVAIGLRD